MTDLRAVIFDLGRVLVDIDFDSGLYRQMADQFDMTPEAMFAQFCKDELFQNYCRGELSPSEFHQRFTEWNGLAISFDEFALAWCDIFLPMPGMLELMTELQQRRTVSILSDTDPLHWNYITSRWPVLTTVEYPTLSFEVGFTKPAPQIFLAAASRIGMKPEECFFTDDLTRNVQGAQAAGMTAVQFTGEADLRQALALHGLLPEAAIEQ